MGEGKQCMTPQLDSFDASRIDAFVATRLDARNEDVYRPRAGRYTPVSYIHSSITSYDSHWWLDTYVEEAHLDLYYTRNPGTYWDDLRDWRSYLDYYLEIQEDEDLRHDWVWRNGGNIGRPPEFPAFDFSAVGMAGESTYEVIVPSDGIWVAPDGSRWSQPTFYYRPLLWFFPRQAFLENWVDFVPPGIRFPRLAIPPKDEWEIIDSSRWGSFVESYWYPIPVEEIEEALMPHYLLELEVEQRPFNRNVFVWNSGQVRHVYSGGERRRYDAENDRVYLVPTPWQELIAKNRNLNTGFDIFSSVPRDSPDRWLYHLLQRFRGVFRDP